LLCLDAEELMPRDTETARRADEDPHYTRSVRECVDEHDDRSTNPKTGEDPGLLPMTEDPRERRMKRNTM